MAQVEVSRLALACKAQHSAAPRIRLEDALQCEIPDDDRLVVIRHMAISAGGSALRSGQRQQALRSAWQTATDGARHGSDTGAPAANCVWFASQAEAEVVLLDLLLRGATPVGWFWKLAVPKWRARPVAVWLPELVADAILPGKEASLVRLIRCCVDSDAIGYLIAALQVLTAAEIAVSTRIEPMRGNAGAALTEPVPADLASTVATASLRQLPASVREALRTLQSAARGAVSVRAILRAQVLQVSPALAIQPMLLAEIVTRTEAALQSPAAALANPKNPAFRQTRQSERTHARTVTQDEQGQIKPEVSAAPDAPQDTLAAPAEPINEVEQRRLPHEPDRYIAPDLIATRPLRSSYAGVWLAVPALADIGFRDWLQNRPELLGDHPGAQLIATIAQHHGCAADDPALAGLPLFDPDQPLPYWTRLWSHALDRWLRRKARRRLHDLVRRPGKLLWSEDRLQVTFALNAADIRLRRLALDRDPGWTDWLGLSVRFAFSDEVRG